MKRLLALILALLCLTSCASMLEREYTQTVPHEEDQVPPGETAYRVETYPALRAAILSYVEEGMAEGALRCPTTYPGNLSVDLEKAKRQLMEEDPLGCYALEDMAFRTSRIIAYYEVELDFTYRAGTKSPASLPRVAGQEKLVEFLREALAGQETSVVVYLTAYPEEDDSFFSDALELALIPDPDGGEEGPDFDQLGEVQLASVELYPKTGSRRVAALELAYSRPEDGPLDGEAAA